jgi:hypothetical protein
MRMKADGDYVFWPFGETYGLEPSAPSEKTDYVWSFKEVALQGFTPPQDCDCTEVEFIDGVMVPVAPKEKPREEQKIDFRNYLYTVSDLGNLSPTEPLVNKLLYCDTLAQLSGPPGTYKSFFALNLACALAAGLDEWEGHKIPKRKKVIYIAAEGASGLRVRILAWCESHDIEPASLDNWLYILPNPVQLGAPTQVEQITEITKQVDAALVIFDTRARCTVGLEENSATEQGKAIEAAETIRKNTHATIWVIHHSSRNGSNPRGSTAWDGAVWSDLRITKEAEFAVKVEAFKHKDAPSDETFEYNLRVHTVSANLMPDPAHNDTAGGNAFDPSVSDYRQTLTFFRPDDRNSDENSAPGRKNVVNLCRNSCGDEGLTRTQIVDLAIDNGVGKTRAYEIVNDLINEGHLRNMSTGKVRRYGWFDSKRIV